MESFATVFAAVLPIFLLVSLGMVLRRVGWLTEEADRTLLNIVVNVLYPCLIFDALLGNEALHDYVNIFIGPLLGAGSIVVGLCIGLILAGLAKMSPDARRAFSFTVGVYNYGYIAIPLVAALYPGDRITMGALLLFNLGVEVAFWTTGLMLLRGAKWQESMGRLLSPPVLAILGAIAASELGLQTLVPGPVRATIHQLGACAVPIALLMIGAVLYDFRGEVRPQGATVPVLACTARMLILPLLILGVGWLLPVSVELKRVIAIQSAMPAGMLTVVLVKQHEGDTAVALQVVISTSLLALITIPLWVKTGLHFLGV